MSKKFSDQTPDPADAAESSAAETGNAGEAQNGEPQPVRTPQVRASICPKSKLHTNTRVYKTLGMVRYCVCDDCGHTWKQHGPPATPKKERAPAA